MGSKTDEAPDAVAPASKKPWVAPQVILSNPMSSASVNNKGISNIPDQKFSSTSTS